MKTTYGTMTSNLTQMLSGTFRAKFGMTSNPKFKWVKRRNLTFVLLASSTLASVSCLETDRKILFGKGCLNISCNPTPIPGNKIKHQVNSAQIYCP